MVLQKPKSVRRAKRLRNSPGGAQEGSGLSAQKGSEMVAKRLRTVVESPKKRKKGPGVGAPGTSWNPWGARLLGVRAHRAQPSPGLA